MNQKITAVQAQKFAAQHLRDAIMSLELAQEYTILTRIIDVSPFNLSSCRRMILSILEDNGSPLALVHYEKMVRLTDGYQDVDKEGLR